MKTYAQVIELIENIGKENQKEPKKMVVNQWIPHQYRKETNKKKQLSQWRK